MHSALTKQIFPVKMQHGCFKLAYFMIILSLKPCLSSRFVYFSGLYEAEDIYRSLGCDVTEQKSFSTEIEQAMKDIT